VRAAKPRVDICKNKKFAQVKSSHLGFTIIQNSPTTVSRTISSVSAILENDAN
jgi:hypothetical protein